MADTKANGKANGHDTAKATNNLTHIKTKSIVRSSLVLGFLSQRNKCSFCRMRKSRGDTNGGPTSLSFPIASIIFRTYNQLPIYIIKKFPRINMMLCALNFQKKKKECF